MKFFSTMAMVPFLMLTACGDEDAHGGSKGAHRSGNISVTVADSRSGTIDIDVQGCTVHGPRSGAKKYAAMLRDIITLVETHAEEDGWVVVTLGSCERRLTVGEAQTLVRMLSEV